MKLRKLAAATAATAALALSIPQSAQAAERPPRPGYTRTVTLPGLSEGDRGLCTYHVNGQVQEFSTQPVTVTVRGCRPPVVLILCQ